MGITSSSARTAMSSTAPFAGANQRMAMTTMNATGMKTRTRTRTRKCEDIKEDIKKNIKTPAGQHLKRHLSLGPPHTAGLRPSQIFLSQIFLSQILFLSQIFLSQIL